MQNIAKTARQQIWLEEVAQVSMAYFVHEQLWIYSTFFPLSVGARDLFVSVSSSQLGWMWSSNCALFQMSSLNPIDLVSWRVWESVRRHSADSIPGSFMPDSQDLDRQVCVQACGMICGYIVLVVIPNFGWQCQLVGLRWKSIWLPQLMLLCTGYLVWVEDRWSLPLPRTWPFALHEDEGFSEVVGVLDASTPHQGFLGAASLHLMGYLVLQQVCCHVPGPCVSTLGIEFSLSRSERLSSFSREEELCTWQLLKFCPFSLLLCVKVSKCQSLLGHNDPVHTSNNFEPFYILQKLVFVLCFYTFCDVYVSSTSEEIDVMSLKK